MARHCMYLPEGSPDITGLVPPIEIHEIVISPGANELALALTSKVMPVLVGSALSQNMASHLAPLTPVSKTREANVPEVT